MTDIYKMLIDEWSKQNNAESNFSFEGSPVGEKTLSTLFYEQILKRALARLSSCAAQNSVGASSEDQDLQRYAALAESIKPTYSNAVSSGFEHKEIEELEMQVIEKIPPNVFSSWVMLVLEKDVLPNAPNLERVFVTQGF